MRLVDEIAADTDPREGAALATAGHWVAHVREPVRFDLAVRALRQRGCPVWVELSPTPVLAASASGPQGYQSTGLWACWMR